MTIFPVSAHVLYTPVEVQSRSVRSTHLMRTLMALVLGSLNMIELSSERPDGEGVDASLANTIKSESSLPIVRVTSQYKSNSESIDIARAF